MPIKRFLTILLLFIVTKLPFLFGQTEKKENFFTSFGLGARAFVMKTSFVSLADDYAAAHWNPGGLAFIDKIQFGAMQAKLSFNRQLGFVSLSVPIDESNKIGLSWKGMVIDQIEGRQLNSLTPDFLFNDIEQNLAISYSRRLWDNFGVGLNLNFLHQSLAEENAGGWGLDFGLLYELNWQIRIGCALYDYHSHLNWSTGHVDYFRKLARLGFSYRLNNHALLALGVAGKNQYSVSSEVRLLPPLVLRTGWQDRFLSLGMGLNFDIGNVEVAFNYAVTNHKFSDQLSHLFDVYISMTKKHPINLATIQTSNVKVRSGPGFNYRTIGVVNKGQQCIILARKANWIKIKYAINKIGWINDEYAYLKHS